jgi:hypothetical protein
MLCPYFPQDLVDPHPIRLFNDMDHGRGAFYAPVPRRRRYATPDFCTSYLPIKRVRKPWGCGKTLEMREQFRVLNMEADKPTDGVDVNKRCGIVSIILFSLSLVVLGVESTVIIT